MLIPSMFQQSEACYKLGPGLLVKTMLDKGDLLPVSFIPELIKRYEKDDSFNELLVGIFGYFMKRFERLKIMDPSGALFSALEYFLSYKSVVEALPSLSIWWPPSIDAVNLNKTFLGCLFHVAPSVDELKQLLPLGLSDSNPSQMMNAFSSVRMASHSYVDLLHGFIYKAIKASPVLKEAIIDFFARAAQLNVNRSKMHIDYKTVSPDGLIMNMFHVLLKLSTPFIGSGNPKASLIDPWYNELNSRIPLDEVTKINMTDSDYAAYKSEVMLSVEMKPANFISDIYYLTVYYFRISYCSQISLVQNLSRSLEQLRQEIDRFKKMSASNPLHGRMLERAEAQLQLYEISIRLNEIVLMDPEFVDLVYLLVDLMVYWMLKLANFENDSLEKRFLSIPEYFIECTSEFVLFVTRTIPRFWTNRPIDSLVHFMVAFLDRPDYMKNPYIRSKFIEIMHGWTSREYAHLFLSYSTMVDQLWKKLMRFYIEVERTGASSQFYDKFNIRFYISMIIKCLWDSPVYREKLREATEDRGTFVQFINFLLNDTSFLLDEAMMKLSEIHKFQEESVRPEWNQLSEEDRKTRLQNHATNERQATAYGQLGGETLNMLAYLTKEIKEPFLQDEVIDHFAAMLNYNLVHLAGPKCRNLRVKNPEQYHFQPRTWLRNLIQVFLNFIDLPRFLEALARDGRSFQPETFKRAASLIGRINLIPESDCVAFTAMIDRVESIQQAETIAEEDLGDIPEEFLDPLMATLMEDPVTLTTSGTIVDRKTIIAHLLNHKIDPFNRMPITMDQVIPNAELKARIDAFISDRRSKRTKKEE